MGLQVRYNSQEEIPEEAREDFVEDTVSEKHKGTWVHKDVFTLEDSIRKERNDNKANKQSIAELSAKQRQQEESLAAFLQLGSLEDIREMRKKVEASNPPPKLEELQEQLRKRTEELRGYQDWKRENEPKLAKLESDYAQLTKRDDRNNARATIHSIVSKIDGVNQAVLEENLYLQYIAGELKRSDAGEIVYGEGETTLSEYAPTHARELGLILPNVSAGANPPARPATKGARAALEAAYAEAQKNNDVEGMLKAKTELGRLAKGDK